MKIELLAFASAGDALGAGQLTLEMPAGSRVADLKERLDRDYPLLAPLWPRLAVAVDGQIVGPEAPLSEGAEVALLPPVSGGSPGTAPERAALVDTPIDSAAITALVAAPERGAVVVFLGTVRNHHRGRPVEKLTYTAYRPMALRGLARIVSELEQIHPGLTAAIVHRLGEVPAGEPSVVIAVASAHRAAAYEASRTALERLKSEIPIWKREHYADGEAEWREEEPLLAPAAAAPAAALLQPEPARG
ncbi:MAG: molybdenum cofactor biosynthesis protein MoaE [Acidobacteriota bacterium]|nr:molybdenum cofactor biosynthesis protein MoaE [Acidobacteriota bacterium]